MTEEEREIAEDIIEEYRDINADLEHVLESLSSLTLQKEELMQRLEAVKSRESEFMERYKDKYGNINILKDLNQGAE
jgi:prefoldin subunit 5